MATLREARIIIPLQDNKGIELGGVHSRFQNTVVNVFGGFTQTFGNGGEKNRRGPANVIERVAIYDIAVDVDNPRTVHLLKALARDAKASARQDAIYLRLATGEVINV